MKNKVAEWLLNFFDETMPVDWQLPIERNQIKQISIDYQANGKKFLVLKFPNAQPRAIRQICHGILADATSISETSNIDLTVIRASVHPSLILHPGAFEYVSYSFGSQIFAEGNIPIGTTLSTTTTDEIKIAFIGMKNHTNSSKYLDPAIFLRILAVFNEPDAALLKDAVHLDWDNNFNLDNFINEYDNQQKGTPRKLLLKEALRQEYYSILELQKQDDPSILILEDPVMEKKYTDRIGHKLDNNATKADILFSFVTQVHTEPDKLASYFITDMGLNFVVFKEDEYDMELIDRRIHGTFEDLAEENTGCQVIVNGPLFDSGSCGLQPIYTRTFEYGIAALSDFTSIGTYKGLTKGTVYLGTKRIPGDCQIPDDPDVWRYYFAQKFNSQYEFKFGRLPAVDQVTNIGTNPDPNEISMAIEPLYGVFRDGKRIGIGHEIDTDRMEPDSVFANKPATHGIPIIGRCFKDGTSFLFVLIREDRYTDPDATSTWEEMIQFMRDIGVVEAFITDGDDSVGLIVKDQLILEPGVKKNTLMPLAIGFIRRTP